MLHSLIISCSVRELQLAVEGTDNDAGKDIVVIAVIISINLESMDGGLNGIAVW